MANCIEKAKERFGKLDKGLVATMKNARPTMTYEKGHTFPLSIPDRFYDTGDEIIDWEKAGSVDKPLRLYAHIPWCKSKCVFCFYESDLAKPSDSDVNNYIDAMGKELDLYRTKLGRDKLKTEVLYIGGGTPTVLSPTQIDGFFGMLKQHIDFTDDAFLITESSPGTLTRDKIRAFRENGVNRMSMGVQTLDDEILRICGRDHDARGAKDAYRLIRNSGMPEINIDIMLALPNQSYESFNQTLKETLELSPSSISFLDLRVCPGSALYSKLEGFHIPTWEDDIAMRGIYQEAMGETGFDRTRPHYYVKPDEMKHRSTRVPCLDARDGLGFQIGLGVSAYSHLENVAFINKTGREYFKAVSEGRLPMDRATLMTKPDRIALKSIRTIVDTTGLPTDKDVFDQYENQIKFMQRNGLMDGDLKLTDDGCLFGEEVVYSFYPKRDASREIAEHEVGFWKARHTGDSEGLKRNLTRKFHLEHSVSFDKAGVVAGLTVEATRKHDLAKGAKGLEADRLWGEATDLLHERSKVLGE